MKNNLLASADAEFQKQFNILDTIDSVVYDENIDSLEHKIKEFEDFCFNKNDRILIYYQDTGFYLELTSGTSVFLYNLYVLLNKYNIPTEFLIIVTNHYGLKKEIDLLNTKFTCSIDKIVETALWYDFPSITEINNTKKQSLEFKNNFLYTCLNNVQRIHRNYILCKFKENNLLSRGIVSYRFKK